jgi:hypothetical protein
MDEMNELVKRRRKRDDDKKEKKVNDTYFLVLFIALYFLQIENQQLYFKFKANIKITMVL